MRYVSLSLALISMPLTVAFAQPQEFRDHNYTSVEQCIERRTARSALIREWSSKGWGWTLKENLEEALAEQDPAACVYAIPAEISKRRQERRERWATAKPPTTRENELIFESIPDCVAYYEERDDSAGRNPLAIDQGPRKECNLEAFAATQMRIREQEAEEKRRRLLETQLARRVEVCRRRNGLREVGSVRLGMSASDVKLCGWGEPEDINRSVGKWGVHEQWVYGAGSYLYIENGVLRSWQN